MFGGVTDFIGAFGNEPFGAHLLIGRRGNISGPTVAAPRIGVMAEFLVDFAI